MAEQEKKEPILPAVSLETLFAVRAEFVQGKDFSHELEILKRLQKENLVIAYLVSEFATRAKEPLLTIFCAMMVYRLLESQIQANKMNDEFKT